MDLDRLVADSGALVAVFSWNLQPDLVELALVDGRIDRKERRMLEFAAGHLDLTDKLPELMRER